MKGHIQLLSSNSDDWETPIYLFNYLDKKFKFKLDPCAVKRNTKCKSYFTKKDDGLNKSWKKYKSVFVNPPYSDIKNWVEKCYLESLKKVIVVMLIPARVDTSYWHDYIFPYANEIIFIRGRLKFNGHKNPSTFPSAIIVFKSYRKKLRVNTLVNMDIKPKSI